MGDELFKLANSSVAEREQSKINEQERVVVTFFLSVLFEQGNKRIFTT